MMRASLVCITLLLAVSVAHAEGERVYQYRPNGDREWSANYYERKGDTWVPHRPEGARDWQSNTFRVEKGEVVQYRPDGRRDWNAPVLQSKPR